MEPEHNALGCGGNTVVMPAVKKTNRRAQILQALAGMLETSPGQRITTAKLAEKVGVSEAALYRHFPSKARMFEGLIEFIEDTLFTRCIIEELVRKCNGYPCLVSLCSNSNRF